MIRRLASLFLNDILILRNKKLITNGGDMLSKLKSLFFVALSSTLFAMPAFAAGLGERGEDIGNTISIWTVVLVIAASLVGIALMIAGGLQLKKYADNPQQNPISKPLVYLIAGIVIFGISATSETMKETIFGADADESGDFEYTRDF